MTTLNKIGKHYPIIRTRTRIIVTYPNGDKFTLNCKYYSEEEAAQSVINRMRFKYLRREFLNDPKVDLRNKVVDGFKIKDLNLSLEKIRLNIKLREVILDVR